MCLDRRSRAKFDKEGFGYKVFINAEKVGIEYRGLCSWADTEERIPVNKWLTAQNTQIIYDDYYFQNNYKTYMSGFHIFKTLEDLYIYFPELRDDGAHKEMYCDENGYEIRRVEYKNARLIGIDGGAKVIIADKMRVCTKKESIA